MAVSEIKLSQRGPYAAARGSATLSKASQIAQLGLKETATHRADKDGILHYISNPDSSKRRLQASTATDDELLKIVPTIQCLVDIQFVGLCHNYALSRLLGAKQICLFTLKEGGDLLSRYFIQTDKPKVDDLVVYYDDQKYSSHWGLYKGDGIVESKWGWHPVYRHPFFDVPIGYGNTICCYKIKDDPFFTELRKVMLLT